MRPQLLPVPSRTVICKEIDDGAVLFCTRTEVYFGVNNAARLIWSLLPPNLTHAEDLDRHMTQAYPEVDPEVIREDIDEFLEGIIAHGLASPQFTAEVP